MVIWQRLPDARRDVRARLHPRDGPGGGPRGCAGQALCVARHRLHPHQPRHRHRLHRPRDGQGAPTQPTSIPFIASDLFCRSVKAAMVRGSMPLAGVWKECAFLAACMPEFPWSGSGAGARSLPALPCAAQWGAVSCNCYAMAAEIQEACNSVFRLGNASHAWQLVTPSVGAASL